MFKSNLKGTIRRIFASIIALSLLLTISFPKSEINAATDAYKDRFMEMWNELHDPGNGYFSPEGVPYHSIETLMVEAPDYGHETTSETFSYYMWLEAMYGNFTGDWTSFATAWDKAEKYIIPTSADQPKSSYNASKPVTYAPEWEQPSGYPAKLDFNVTTGNDPINDELVAAYGTSQMYGMHWIIDTDNWYGYGSRGDGTSKPSYFNTFQRGEQESTWETVPHPSWEAFKWGGTNGFLDLFIGDNSYSKQWRYTNAPDADSRAVQATYWANKWARQQGKDISTLVGKASKMGDYLRYSLFDKFFMKIGAQGKTAGSGYSSAHYLQSWYYAWGGDISGSWSWKEGSSHNHFGYQNPMSAWVLSNQTEFKPKSANGAGDWAKSLQRQLEFYQWLQSKEGAIAGGATNSWNGRYETYPAGTPTFYGMAYVDHPVYRDPGSNEWFGMQAWSMQRVAEYYYSTGDAKAKAILDKWVTWVKSVVKLNSDGTFQIPSKLNWSGKPDNWTGTYTGNPNLSVSVIEYGTDLGVTGSLANALLYYSAATKLWSTYDDDSRELAKQLLDRMWTLYRDDKGVSAPEARADYNRFFEQEVYVPANWTGKMANGDAIKSGVKFVDIRSKYKSDPDWQKLVAAYNAGTAPVFNYHRFWAQCDVALANGLYSVLFGTPANNSTISPTAATFDKKISNQADIAVVLTLNGNTFNGIKNGTTPLVEGTDYTVTNDTVTVLKSYLAKQPVGTATLTFDFSNGIDPALTVTVTDTTPPSTISPTTAAFDKNTAKQTDIAVTLTPNGNTLDGIYNGSSALASGTDYTVSGNVITILKSYLAKQPVGTTSLTFDVSSGVDPVLTIAISDSTVQPGNIKVKFYNSNTSAQSNSIYGKINLVNTGTTDINLSSVKLRYYYTIDGEKPQSFWCDWSSAGSSNVTGTFVKMTTPKTGADYYLEIGFTSGAGTLKAGQSIEVQTRMAKSDWTNYNQADDYSFNSSASGYTDWDKVTGYVSDTLNWGIEP